METLNYTEITEVRESTNPKEVNRLIKDGWLVLAIGASDDSSLVRYSLGWLHKEKYVEIDKGYDFGYNG